MTAIGKRRKGQALVTSEAATSNGAGRALTWRVQRPDREAFHAAAERRGTTASDLAREVVDEAARATAGSIARVGDDYTHLSARFSHEQIEQISQAAGLVEIEPTVWLRLMTTPAGELLLEQLRRAVAARRR